MGQPRPVARRQPLLIATVVAAALVWAAIASSTRPFTGGADLVTALPAIVAVSALVVRTRAAGRPTSTTPPEHPSEPGTKPLGRWSLVWLAMTTAVVSWELFCYASAPRRQHPTLSTLIDMLDASRAGKISVFALWLVLGWYLVLR